MMTAGPYGGPMSNNDGPMGQRMPGNDVGMGRPPPSRDQSHQNSQREQHFGGENRNNFGNNQRNNFSNGDREQRFNSGPNSMELGSIPSNDRDRENSGRPIDLRIILSRDEVAFLFGFDGNLINQLRQQTGAHIQITEGESFEYVLLISGAIDIIFKAFSLVCRKLWDLLTNIAGPGHNRPLKIRIAVPAIQCGSIIGKAGAKVKEIRDLTGAQIQVSHEPLPNSSERCVEISGSGESCLQCTYHICCVMQDTPLRGEVIPYIPPVNNPPSGPGGPQGHPGTMGSMNHPGGGPVGPGPPPNVEWRPVFLCGDKAFIIDKGPMGPLARPAPPELLRRELAKTPLGGEVAESLANNKMPDHMNPLALMAAIAGQQNGSQGSKPQTSQEMTVNGEMINIMMAQSQGQKIEEIRRMSGAQIHISDQQGPGSNPNDRLITLSGPEESILLAQFLIQSNVDTIVKERQQHNHHLPPPSGHPGGHPGGLGGHPGGPGGHPGGPGGHPGGHPGGIPPFGPGSNSGQQRPPTQMGQQQNHHQNNLHSSNQFDPSIMQGNFDDKNFHEHPGGPGSNPNLQPPPFQQQRDEGFNRQGGPPPGGNPPGGNFRNNSSPGDRFPGPHQMGPGSNPGRGGRGGRRSPPGDRRGGRRGRR